MQSSVRSETPRLVTISANLSSTSIPLNGGVQIDREVVVTSHREPSKRVSYASLPPSSGHNRAQSHGQLSRTPLNRVNSDSRMSERSLKRHSRPNWSQYDSANSVYLDTNRESMRALTEFLMTKEPPASNWVSIPSDDELSLRTIKRYKVFGLEHKKKKKIPKSPKFMQLPDVAVAATTRQGSRHIAISIPLKHDLPELLRPSSQPLPRPQTAPRLHTSDRGAVTILKPVVEVRESNSSISPPPTSSSTAIERDRLRAASVATPPIEILGVEATRTLENYYIHLQRQQQKSKAESKRPETARGPQTQIGTVLSPSKSDPRHSGATIYSTTTYSTGTGHSRGVSSVSTAPSVIPIAGLRLDNLPPRKSSRSTIPASIGEELRMESARISATEQSKTEGRENPRKSANGSFKSSASSLTTPPTVFATGTADLARSYQSPGAQYFSRSNTPLSISAPNKKLPELPPGAQIRRPSTAPLSETSPVTDVTTTAKRTSSVKNNTSELEQATQQSRLERVKARKMRDLAASRVTKDGSALTESHFQTPPTQSKDLGRLVPPSQPQPQTRSSRSHKYRGSQELAIKKSLNSLSPIMVVANLPPFTGLVLPSDLPSPPLPKQQALRKSSSGASTSTMMRVAHTPPRSIHEEFGGSDSDTIPTRPHSISRSNYSIREKRTSTSPNRAGSTNGTLDARRQERRSKRNMTLHERELDKRIERLERDNALLVGTLRVIAGSFGMLNRLLPESSAEKDIGMGEVEGEDRAVEVLMRELQSNAKSVSRDFPTSTSRVRLEGSEEDENVVRVY